MNPAAPASRYLRYWQPADGTEVSRRVTDIAEIVAVARQAGAAYATDGDGRAAGLALWQNPDSPQDSLTIAHPGQAVRTRAVEAEAVRTGTGNATPATTTAPASPTVPTAPASGTRSGR